MKSNKIGFIASSTNDAQKALLELSKTYENVNPSKADIIVALGGDGLLLHALETFGKNGVPVYGMNKGTVGFLMNNYTKDNLLQKIEKAEITTVNPLIMEAIDINNNSHKGYAINEVSLLRQSRMTAKISININGKNRLPELVCDGILVATPAGSTAYNLSAHGPILPLNSELLSLTSICAFRPRRWGGALLPKTSNVELIVNEPKVRGVSASAGNIEIRDVKKVNITLSNELNFNILFDPENSLEERFLIEQFSS